MENQTRPNAALAMKTRQSDQAVAWWQSDSLFVAATIALVLLVTTIPYVYGYLSTPADKQFMGIMLDVPDHAQYFSWMRELSYHNLASNMMTPEYNRPVFFNLLWWGMGRLGLILGLGFAGMYQVLRVTATILFFLVIYLLCGWFIKDRFQRRTAFMIAVFTSGLGWMLVVLKYLSHGDLLFPLDVYVAEGNTFLGVLGYAHFIEAALYVFIFYLVLQGQKKGQYRYAVYAGLLGFFLGWQHTYDLASVYGVLLAYALLLTLRDRRLPVYMIWSGIIIGAISCWPGIYSVWLTTADPIWKQVLAQFANAGVFTPLPWHLPILLGLPFLLAIYTLIRQNPLKLTTKDDGQIFVMGWFLATFGLVYLPVDFQIHLLNGWQIPIAILATQGLFNYVIPFVQEKIGPRLTALRKRIDGPSVLQGVLVGVFLLAILPTNVYLWSWRFVDLQRHDYPYYLYQDDLTALKWIEKNASPDDVVLSSLTIGQYLPAMTGTHAYLAHWAETLDFFGKSANVTQFYSSGTSDLEREQILRAGNVKYVFYGPAERALGSASPDSMPYLKKVFSQGRDAVYLVQLPG